MNRPESWATRIVWLSGLVIALAALVSPIFLVEVPPLVDYPNHLARGYFLVFGPNDPILSKMFGVEFSLIPNLASDVLFLGAMSFLPPLMAGKVVLAATVVLPTTGAIALSRILFNRFSFWQLGAGLIAYNALFLTGFINFQLSVGVALWGAAAWATFRGSPVLTAVLGFIFGLVSYFAHVFGFLFFALLIISMELVTCSQPRDRTTKFWRVAFAETSLLVVTLLPPTTLYLTSQLASTETPLKWRTPVEKLYFLLTPLLAHSFALSAALASILFLIMISWILRSKLRLHPLFWIFFPTMAVLYIVLPVGAKGGYWIDTRVPVLLGFSLFAITMPVDLYDRERVVLSSMLLILLVGRMALIGEQWIVSRQDIANLRTVLEPVSPGARVLAVAAETPIQKHHNIIGPKFPVAWGHYAALALIDRHAFWADAFSIPGQQPVVAKFPYNASGDGGTKPIRSYATLSRDAPTLLSTRDNYLVNWPQKFDYVLLLNAEAVQNLEQIVPQHLKLIRSKGIAALYRVQQENVQ